MLCDYCGVVLSDEAWREGHGWCDRCNDRHAQEDRDTEQFVNDWLDADSSERGGY